VIDLQVPHLKKSMFLQNMKLRETQISLRTSKPESPQREREKLVESEQVSICEAVTPSENTSA
jgi:hypothetical protein